MGIKGALTDVSLADISQLLGVGGKTGCLTLTHRENHGYVYFQGGRVIYASVVDRPDRIGELLVAREVINRDQLSAAIANQEWGIGRKLLGEVLVEQGSLTQEKLEEYISLQIEEAVYIIFQWSEGTFEFEPDVMPDERVFRVSVSIDALLMEGARRVDEWSVVEKKITSMDLIFSLERNPLEDEGLDLTDDQKSIIPLTDGQRTVTDLVEDSGLTQFDTGKALYGLIQAGFAVQVGRRVAEDKAEGSLEEHLGAGLAAYKSGSMDDATRELRKALEVDPTHPTGPGSPGADQPETGQGTGGHRSLRRDGRGREAQLRPTPESFFGVRTAGQVRRGALDPGCGREARRGRCGSRPCPRHRPDEIGGRRRRDELTKGLPGQARLGDTAAHVLRVFHFGCGTHGGHGPRLGDRRRRPQAISGRGGDSRKCRCRLGASGGRRGCDRLLRESHQG